VFDHGPDPIWPHICQAGFCVRNGGLCRVETYAELRTPPIRTELEYHPFPEPSVSNQVSLISFSHKINNGRTPVREQQDRESCRDQPLVQHLTSQVSALRTTDHHWL
jgi:hypothetical protein